MKKLALLFGLVALLAFAPAVEAGGKVFNGGKVFSAPTSVLAVEVCVTLRENRTGGDTWTKCGSASSLSDSNLAGDTTGLTGGGCAAVFNNPDWNNCASSVRTENLPANYRVRFYDGANFSSVLECIDIDGSPGWWGFATADNDKTTSWRVEGGNC